MSTSTTRPEAVTRAFPALAEEWKQATRYASAPSAAAEHPAYRAIVELGPEVVPLILRELMQSPHPWFAALRELTGTDPVPPAERGRPAAAAERWIAWGRSNGLV